MKCKIIIDVKFNRPLWSFDEQDISIKEVVFKSSKDIAVVKFKTCNTRLLDAATDVIKFDLIDYDSNKDSRDQLVKLKNIMEHQDTILDNITFTFKEDKDYHGDKPHALPLEIILFWVKFYEFENAVKNKGICKSQTTMYCLNDKALNKLNTELEKNMLDR